MKPFALLAVSLAIVPWGGSSRAARRPLEWQPSQSTHSPADSTQTTSAPTPQAVPSPHTHTVRVQFDYDFTKNRACSTKEKAKTCIKQFDVYDVSGGKFKLFSIPAPADAKGIVKGISGTSPPRVFEPGTHFIAVTAENAGGKESSLPAARTTVTIPPATPAAPQPAPSKP
ncbi:MAG TPA: hypothetical protein VNE63_00205 [Candidatus Acidoferrales bacterium]|nr:hypothetical protein [Candidatus Acidoferrales bacterium]